MLGFRLIFVHQFHIVSFSFKIVYKLRRFMSRHEITNDDFVIVDNLSMKKSYNYDKTVMDIFLI